MSTDTLDLYLENVASFINDDDKLVTYKWLSKELEVHVNIAKEILQKYYNDHKDNVDATFLIKGQLDDGSLRMEVVRASSLETSIQKFTCLDFQHIYSVQKALPDIELLATTGEGDVRFSAIKLEKNPLKTKEIYSKEPEELKCDDRTESKKEIKKVEEKPKVEDKAKVEEKENRTKEEEKEKPKATKTENAKSNSKTNKKPIQSTQAGFKNLFGKVANQKKPASSINGDTSSDSNSNVKKKEEQKKIISPVKEVKENEKTSKKKSPEHSRSFTEKSKSVSQSPKTALVKKTQESKKRSRGPAKKGTTSKRKRIVIDSDSSDENEKSDRSEMEEEPEEIIEAPRKKFTRW